MKVLDINEFEETVKEIEDSKAYKKFQQDKRSREEMIIETMQELDNPINAQRSIIAKLKLYVDDRIEREIMNDGDLSNMTRVWAKDVIGMLNDLQIGMYGSKSVNLNLGTNGEAVSHAQIAQKIKQLRNTK